MQDKITDPDKMDQSKMGDMKDDLLELMRQGRIYAVLEDGEYKYFPTTQH